MEFPSNQIRGLLAQFLAAISEIRENQLGKGAGRRITAQEMVDGLGVCEVKLGLVLVALYHEMVQAVTDGLGISEEIHGHADLYQYMLGLLGAWKQVFERLL